MLDSNWQLINGPNAHRIEFLNYANQVNAIEALFLLLTDLGGDGEGEPCRMTPNANALCELHRTGTLFLLEKPGQYRTEPVHLARTDGTVVYSPPDWPTIPQHMAEFDRHLGQNWHELSPLKAAAYALWKINWIHPFLNGNGRTARAFAYACLCLKFGFMLPGTPTVIDLIGIQKPEFEVHLKAADAAFSASGLPDLTGLETFLERLVVQQLSDVS